MRLTVTKQALVRLGRSLAFRLVLLLVLLYTAYHCVAAFSDRVVTDIVIEGEERTTLNGEAILFRDETVLTVSGGNHLCSYPQPNGAKVNAATTLAQLYASAQDAETLAKSQAELTLLDRQIALAEKTPTADTLALLPSLQRQAVEALLDTERDISDGAPMRDISDGAFSVLLSLNRISALTEQTSSEALLSSLRAERQRLLMATGYTARTVTVADLGTGATGGYFYYGTSVDGYENIFHRSALDTMELSDLDAWMVQQRQDYGTSVTVVGKLVSGYRWSIVLPLEPDAAEVLEVGRDYEVSFREEGGITLRMSLDRLVGSRAEGRILAVLTADTAPTDFHYTRFTTVELTVARTSGYRLPETALTEVDGVTGVYILDGGRVCFRTVEILTEGDGYVLVYAPTKAQREDETTDTYHADRYIALRDVVITEGDDLYDGKYID